VTTRKEVEQKKRIMPRLFSGYCQDGFPLDDHARAQISIELDYELPYLIHKGACEEEKRALIRALNLARRQLTPVAKREIIAAQIRETPKLSNRRIAKALGVSHSTVMSVRNELARTGRVVQSDHLVGLDGRERPDHSTIRPSAPSVVARAGNFGFASTANRQRIAKSGGSFNRHRITPLNVRRGRHIRRRLVAVPTCTPGGERHRRAAPEAGDRAAQCVSSRPFVRFPAYYVGK
jgi:hypothetical protein